MRRRPPVVDGLAASRLQLPPGPWTSVLDALCARFPGVSRDQWRDRMARGRVLGPEGVAIRADTPYRVGLEISYYREVADEPRLALEEGIVHLDAHVLVADKPHGLPVTPAGAAVRETLLARLVRRVGNEALAPLHRIDRDTAGLVMFSTNPETRAAYQALFREHRIRKRYQALAPPLPGMQWPSVHRSRLARGEPFFRMGEVRGEPNSETRMDVLERGSRAWLYQLEPVTGRKHQLRVHMASLGAPILGDRLYPELQPGHDLPASTSLQLLATGLEFVDPLDASKRSFGTGFTLPAPEAI